VIEVALHCADNRRLHGTSKQVLKAEDSAWVHFSLAA
jgi:hypothetical protein